MKKIKALVNKLRSWYHSRCMLACLSGFEQANLDGDLEGLIYWDEKYTKHYKKNEKIRRISY